MNDPHVKSIHYRLLIGERVFLKKTSPIREETDEFVLLVENNLASFDMKKHFSTERDAKAHIKAFLERWEFFIGLTHEPGDLQFKYKNSELIDRSPDNDNSGIFNAGPAGVAVGAYGDMYVPSELFLPPPKSFKINPDVKTLYNRYKDYTEGKEKLLPMAYMCFTVLKTSAGGIEKAASRYSISKTVLKKT